MPKKKRPGAPKKKASTKRTQRIPVPVTKSEKRDIEKAAKSEGMTSAGFLRWLYRSWKRKE